MYLGMYKCVYAFMQVSFFGYLHACMHVFIRICMSMHREREEAGALESRKTCGRE